MGKTIPQQNRFESPGGSSNPETSLQNAAKSESQTAVQEEINNLKTKLRDPSLTAEAIGILRNELIKLEASAKEAGEIPPVPKELAAMQDELSNEVLEGMLNGQGVPDVDLMTTALMKQQQAKMKARNNQN